jgi:hypothetical protein
VTAVCLTPLPAQWNERAETEDKSTLGILEANQNLVFKLIAPKPTQDSCAANVRTMMHHGTQDHDCRDPFAGAKVTSRKH